MHRILPRRRLLLTLCGLLCGASLAVAQDYEWPDDPLVRENLEAWQDLLATALKDQESSHALLVPVIDSAPMVVSAGGYCRHGDDGHGAGPRIAGQLFWGSRSYNFHANYVMAFGLLGQLRWGLGDSRETAVVIAAQLDIAAPEPGEELQLALPWSEQG